MNGWYGLLLAFSKVLGLVALAGTAARGLVAFSVWRSTLRNRLLGADTGEEVS